MLISNSYYSIQPHGPNIGTPTVFIEINDDASIEFKMSAEWINFLRLGAHLMFTGSTDPMLNQKSISKWIGDFAFDNQFTPHVSVETPGNVRPNLFMCAIVKNWIIDRDRYRMAALVNTFYEIPSICGDVVYNFTVYNSDEVIGLILALEKLTIAPGRFMFTPTSHHETTEIVEACMACAVRFNTPLFMLPIQKNNETNTPPQNTSAVL